MSNQKSEVIVALSESQYDWLVETVEYEIDYFKKLGTDRTESDDEQFQSFQALKAQLEVTLDPENG